MRILELEKLFQKEETLNEVLEMLKGDINMVDYWSGVRKDNLTNNSEEVNKALNELSGCFGTLRTALAIADTELTNREVREYNSEKIKFEKGENKFTSQIDSATKKQASASVAKYRRIYNLIKGYTEVVDKHIITLQSILKDLAKDYNHPQG